MRLPEARSFRAFRLSKATSAFLTGIPCCVAFKCTFLSGAGKGMTPRKAIPYGFLSSGICRFIPSFLGSKFRQQRLRLSERASKLRREHRRLHWCPRRLHAVHSRLRRKLRQQGRHAAADRLSGGGSFFLRGHCCWLNVAGEAARIVLETRSERSLGYGSKLNHQELDCRFHLG